MMTGDYMDRPVEMILMDAFLTTELENIAILQDKNLRLPLVIALGAANIDRIDAMHEIFVEAEKRAARYVVYKAQACGYIDSYDGVAIRQMITHMGEEEFKTWN